MRAVIQHGGSEAGWLLFENPRKVLEARSLPDVIPTLESVEAAVQDGLHAAGFISYEASPAFDPALVAREPGNLPLVWFGLFENAKPFCPPDRATPDNRPQPEWKSCVSRSSYEAAIAGIRSYLKNGDTYQVNFTLRLRCHDVGDPWNMFLRLISAQQAGYSAFVDTGQFSICSASPELFFSLDGTRLLSRPMKGTSARGRTTDEDASLAEELSQSEKNRAENVMIVDMIRNDLGRIADPGSVNVISLYDLERYPTLWQMTSTVECNSDAGLTSILSSLFPCASVTGAPKVRTMQIIRELEPEPRGVYTGCVGFFSPGRKAQFNVAIRTVTIDTRSALAECGVGGGIVWDSDSQDEYDECLTKAAFLTSRPTDFMLLETILWDGDTLFLIDRHLSRIAASARYFGYSCNLEAINLRLSDYVRTMKSQRVRVRLLLSRRGEIHIEHLALTPDPPGVIWRVALARKPVDSKNPMLYHKTTDRSIYERARTDAVHLDDVILWNERGEVTESTIANVVVEQDGQFVTPPVQCGLLAGVYRQLLLDTGKIRECVLPVENLFRASRVYLVNSVRTWIPVSLQDEPSLARQPMPKHNSGNHSGE
jgi:para-aminobenzoate synthetase/4-amino-4-deoxychorismate lyase